MSYNNWLKLRAAFNKRSNNKKYLSYEKIKQDIILCFHGFATIDNQFDYSRTSKSLLKYIINIISKDYLPVSLDEMMNSRHNHKQPKFAVTIDDGYASIQHVMHVFKEFAIVPTVFICPSLIEMNTIPFPEVIKVAILSSKEKYFEEPWSSNQFKMHSLRSKIKIINYLQDYLMKQEIDLISNLMQELLEILNVTEETIKESVYYDKLLDWSELKTLIPEIEVGSHTCHHYNIGNLESSFIKSEIFDSKNMIEEKLDLPCKYFAYPFGSNGSHTPESDSYVKTAGYTGSYTLNNKFLTHDDNTFNLPRINVGNGLSNLIKLYQ
jgi:peptidoglycan/xylan/chitin deacetylase (PgdA/CDA1 family)